MSFIQWVLFGLVIIFFLIGFIMLAIKALQEFEELFNDDKYPN